MYCRAHSVYTEGVQHVACEAALIAAEYKLELYMSRRVAGLILVAARSVGVGNGSSVISHNRVLIFSSSMSRFNHWSAHACVFRIAK